MRAWGNGDCKNAIGAYSRWYCHKKFLIFIYFINFRKSQANMIAIIIASYFISIYFHYYQELLIRMVDWLWMTVFSLWVVVVMWGKTHHKNMTKTTKPFKTNLSTTSNSIKVFRYHTSVLITQTAILYTKSSPTPATPTTTTPTTPTTTTGEQLPTRERQPRRSGFSA